jgi:hypothetical protein
MKTYVLKGKIQNLIEIFKQEERSPEALISYLAERKIKITWKALMNRWDRV